MWHLIHLPPPSNKLSLRLGGVGKWNHAYFFGSLDHSDQHPTVWIAYGTYYYRTLPIAVSNLTHMFPSCSLSIKGSRFLCPLKFLFLFRQIKVCVRILAAERISIQCDEMRGVVKPMVSVCIAHLKAQPLWILFLISLGFFSLLKASFPLFKWLYITFLRPHKNLKNYGSWALITGSTDGIGKAFAFQLAQKGLSLLLVSRNQEKLKQVSSEIHGRFPNVKIKTVAIDFSGDTAPGLREMEGVMEGLDIGILINNVGVTYPGASYFHEVDESVWMNLVKVNLIGTTVITRAVLPGMLERKKGAIVNIGSGAAIVVPSHPLYAIYGATKAYIDQLSRSLNVEYSRRGIDVQCQVPLYVWTKMASRVASIERPGMFTPSADDYVKAAVGRIGFEGRCTPYWSHSLQWFLASLLPHSLLDWWRFSIGISRMKKASSLI